MSGHLIFKRGVSHGSIEVLKEDGVEISVGESYVTETKSDVEVLVVLDEVVNSEEQSVESVLHNINTKHGSSSDWHWVGVDASESLLEDRVLALSWGDLLLAWVTNK